MVAQSKTKPSTRRLSEVARHVVIPADIVTTGWPAVEAKCLEFGDRFDTWQSGLGRAILGKRADGTYAATIGGITLSIPRQVAKTFLVGRIIFALCVLFPNTKVLWTAHRTRTATNTFKSLQGFAKRKKVAPYVSNIRQTNGEQEIAFTNGSVIMFGAREQGFGRGFDEVDIEVFDEAQILTEKALEDMVAATNQSHHPHGALLFYMGTPPRPVDPGEVFKARRSEALSGESEDAVYVECSADEDADPDDRRQWAKANPSFPHRTPLRSMLRLRKNLPSDDSWRREALGIWDKESDAVKAKLPADKWALTGVGKKISNQFAEPASAAFDVDKDGATASISVAAGSLKAPYVELIEHRPHVGWLPAAVVALLQAHPNMVIGCNGAGDAGAQVGPIIAAMAEAKIPAERLKQFGSVEYRQACGGFYTDVTQITEGESRPRLMRPMKDQGPLDRAVADATERPLAGAWVWDLRNVTVPISPLVSCTIARALLPIEPIKKIQAPMFAMT